MATGEAHIEIPSATVDKFRALRVRLKTAEKEVRLKFLASVRATMAPLKDDIRQSALDLLPKRGGLAARVADSKFGTRTGPASVTFQTINPYEIKAIDRGKLRHKTFGHTPWVNQPVSDGFWSKPTDKRLPEIVAAVDEAMDDVVKQIEKG